MFFTRGVQRIAKFTTVTVENKKKCREIKHLAGCEEKKTTLKTTRNNNSFIDENNFVFSL
jgi:hypothetical protein